MKMIVWDQDKNIWLKQHRGIGFEEVVEAFDDDRLLADLPNTGENYPHQRVFVVEIEGYAIVVPYVQDDETVFLKTLFPDRKATLKFLKGLSK